MAPAIRYEDVRVTPTKAKEWLDLNDGNRIISPKVVAAYARDMAKGDWLFNPSPISFDTDGKLVDGQHRLLAVIQSGMPQKFHVAYNIPREHRKVIDIGRKRSVADNLVMDYGIKNASQVTAAGRIIIRWRMGTLRSTGTIKISEPEVYEFVVENDETLQEAASFAQKLRRTLPIPIAASTAAYHETMRVDEVAAKVFWDKIMTGAELKVGDPVLSLRSAVTRLGTKHEDRSLINLELIVRAWRVHLKGQTSGKTFTLKILRQIKEADFAIEQHDKD